METMEFNLLDVLIGSSVAVAAVFVFDVIRRWRRAT